MSALEPPVNISRANHFLNLAAVTDRTRMRVEEPHQCGLVVVCRRPLAGPIPAIEKYGTLHWSHSRDEFAATHCVECLLDDAFTHPSRSSNGSLRPCSYVSA